VRGAGRKGVVAVARLAGAAAGLQGGSLLSLPRSPALSLPRPLHSLSHSPPSLSLSCALLPLSCAVPCAPPLLWHMVPAWCCPLCSPLTLPPLSPLCPLCAWPHGASSGVRSLALSFRSLALSPPPLSQSIQAAGPRGAHAGPTDACTASKG